MLQVGESREYMAGGQMYEGVRAVKGFGNHCIRGFKGAFIYSVHSFYFLSLTIQTLKENGGR